MRLEEMRVNEIRGVVRYVPRVSSFRASARRDHIVGIQLSGRAIHDFGDRRLTLGAGMLYFFNRREDYSVTVLEPCEAFSIHFTTYGEIEDDSVFLPTGNPAEILRLLETAEAAYAAGGRGELTLLSLLYRLLSEISRLREKVYSKSDDRLLHAREYLDAHFREEGCLAAAAALTGLSPRRFGELFRRSFDQSPGHYLAERRLECARRLLGLSELSVTEVASRCGFSDVYYFSKFFKRATGCSPSEWRRLGFSRV